ncbi:unnamed protein product [Miscanthus lutarioriparius]|uniref:Uncharacterized protein n=1 Tax=Miscanthus lutarioriparius TaxID=422564 RepID=A0A811MFB4_9POAL|nr:unnamed protein product [Miscanthus lutarioriparius]
MARTPSLPMSAIGVEHGSGSVHAINRHASQYTLFSLGETYLFAQLVDFMDKNPGKASKPELDSDTHVHVRVTVPVFPPKGFFSITAGPEYEMQPGLPPRAQASRSPSYPLMYRDVRSAVDLCHRDGTLKRMVAKDPARYINEDLAIVPMLEMIRKSGRSTFLVTNSLWDYTDVVMNYLCGPYTSDVGSGLNHNWLQYFDIVITGRLVNLSILIYLHGICFSLIYAILREDRKPKIKSSTLNTSSESLPGRQCWSSPQITFCCF